MMRHAYLLAAVLGATGVSTNAVEPEEENGDIMFHGLSVNRVLFLGNSITRHGPSAKVDWSGNWGMAASAEDKDFVHIILQAFTKAGGKEPQSLISNIATFERTFETYDIDAKFQKEFAFKADLVIVAIGENVPGLKTEESKHAFKASVTKLLKKLKAHSDPVILVRTCFWANTVKDTLLKQACDEVGGILADSGALSKDERNYGRSEREFTHKGVAAHPGDRGMQAIADVILNALKAAAKAE